jgi:hypothetical protein
MAVTTYSFLVLAKGGMNNTHIKQDLGRVGNVFKVFQRLVELVVVVPRQGGDPCLYLLP